MKLKAKRSSFGAFGNVDRGQIVTVEDVADAKKLIETGLYSEYDKAAEEQEERERAEAHVRSQELVLKVDASVIKTELDRVMEEMEAAKAAHLDLTEQLGTKSQTIREFRAQLDEQEEKLSDLNAQLAKASSDLAERDATIARLQSENAGLSSELTQSQADLADRDSAITDLEAAIEAQAKSGETENAGKTRTKKGD